MKFKDILDDLVGELEYENTHPSMEEFTDGYKQGIIFAIDRLIDGKSFPVKGNKYKIISHSGKKLIYGKSTRITL